jgi:heme A synthase
MGAQEQPMAGRLWLEPPRRVLTSFLVVVVACVAALVWLGSRRRETGVAYALLLRALGTGQ